MHDSMHLHLAGLRRRLLAVDSTRVLLHLLQAAQVSETLSTCRFAQRMLQVTENAQQNTGSLSSVHGNLYKLDPVMQQYLEASPSPHDLSHHLTLCQPDACKSFEHIPNCTSSWHHAVWPIPCGPSPGI